LDGTHIVQETLDRRANGLLGGILDHIVEHLEEEVVQPAAQL
jgi:hypothetical protein